MFLGQDKKVCECERKWKKGEGELNARARWKLKVNKPIVPVILKQLSGNKAP